MSSNNWKNYKLDEIAEIIGGGTPSTTNPDFWGEEIPWITPRDLASTDERFISRGERCITKKGLQNSSARLLPAGTVLLTTRAPIGYLRIALNPICTNQGFKSLIPKVHIADNQFLFYLLKNNVEYLKSVGVGTTFAEISGSALRQIEFLFPSLSTQRRIADILSALDDKIELNRQTNATLEAIAQAIFKEWFVNFNFPGATGEMIESELGMIPKGWKVGKLGEICEFAYGKGLKSEIRVEGKYPVVGSNGIVGTHNDYLAEGPGIVIGRKGTIGEVTWVHQNFFPIDTTFYINDLLGVNDLYFHYFLLKEQDFKKIGSDSAVPGLNRNQAYVSLVVIPAKDVINQFNDITQAIFADIYNYSNESSTLATIRDTLLPKLMSGEIE